jgi:phage repressor protein C with HTH and peptisase S24 domain
MSAARNIVATDLLEVSNKSVAERSERLRAAVREAGGTSAVAKRGGIPLGTLNNYLAGRDLRAEGLVALARATGVRLEWLATGEGPMRAGDAAEAPLASGTVAVARYDARAAAGRRALLAEARIIEQVTFDEGWVRRVLRRNPGDLAIIEAFGDSMAPTILDGDVLMLDTAIADLVSGRIYVVDLGGELLVKRIQRRLNGSLLVLSDNDRYPPEELQPSEAAPLRIVGEVVWHARAV